MCLLVSWRAMSRVKQNKMGGDTLAVSPKLATTCCCKYSSIDPTPQIKQDVYLLSTFSTKTLD